MDPELTRKVEAVLFASGRFMDATHIASLIEANEKNVVRALEVLQENFASAGSALRVVEEDGAWKIHVRDEYLELVSRVVSDTEISGPVLETLAVIAWRTPILQAEVVDIRGSNAYEHVKELVERSFVVKEPQGRTYQLRITDKFFHYFDIEGRDDIRKVFKEVEEEHRKKEMELELEQKRLEQAMRKAEQGTPAVVDTEEEPVKAPASEKKVEIDNLDAVLEKAARHREEMDVELKAAKKETEETGEDQESAKEDEADKKKEPFTPSEPVEEPEEDTDTLEETRKKAEMIRKSVEEDLEALDK